MAEMSSGWSDLLDVVRRCERGEPLPESDRQESLQLATAVGLATLPGAVGCSITLQQPAGGFFTPAAAGDVATLLDGVQYAIDDGPCVRAARTGQPERVDEIGADPRWPDLARQAVDHGVASSLSLPLLTSRSPAARIHRAITDRTLITCAQGVVMAQERLSAPLAYRQLAIRSATESSSLRDVAQRVLAETAVAAGTEEDVSA